MIFLILVLLGGIVFFCLVFFLPFIIDGLLFYSHKKKKEAEWERNAQEIAQAKEIERQEEERKRQEEETLKPVLRNKYLNNSNLNKMFDDCVDAILALCKKRQRLLIEKKGSYESIELEVKVTGDYIDITPGCNFVYFSNYDIIPLRGENVKTKVITIREILSERLCYEINKIDSNVKAEPHGSYVYVTITNEPQGVEL